MNLRQIMQGNIDDFFIPDNEVKLPEELDYSRTVEYTQTAEALSEPGRIRFSKHHSG